jgi:hypothetical protein
MSSAYTECKSRVDLVPWHIAHTWTTMVSPVFVELMVLSVTHYHIWYFYGIQMDDIARA